MDSQSSRSHPPRRSPTPSGQGSVTASQSQSGQPPRTRNSSAGDSVRSTASARKNVNVGAHLPLPHPRPLQVVQGPRPFVYDRAFAHLRPDLIDLGPRYILLDPYDSRSATVLHEVVCKLRRDPGLARRMLSRDSYGVLPQFESKSLQHTSASFNEPDYELTKMFARRKISQIEASVTRLLVATKQLLETLANWSRGTASDNDVSDVYVRLGSEFNIACRAFTAIGVETADLGNVPETLRSILEATLTHDATPASLDLYLPRIREIIINLLQGLKKKQQKLRARNMSQSSEDGAEQERAPPSRSNTSDMDGSSTTNGPAPPRSSSLPNGRYRTSPPSAPPPYDSRVSQASQAPQASNRTYNELTTSATSTNLTQRLDLSGVYIPTTSMTDLIPEDVESTPPPPPPPSSFASATPVPRPRDPLAQLQRGGDLERRASRRYSHFQLSKLAGAAPGEVPTLPTSILGSQRGATLNTAGARESLEAVRARGKEAVSKLAASSSAPRPARSPARRPSKVEEGDESGVAFAAAEQRSDTQTFAEKEGPLTESSPALPPGISLGLPEPEVLRPSRFEKPQPPAELAASTIFPSTKPAQLSQSQARVDTPPLSAKEMTVFLQMGRSVKKVLIDSPEEISLSSLRLLFISKFTYNPPSGEDFPDIYIQDPVSGVRYELEDMHDVKDRTVLALNIEILDEVKRHVDEGMNGLKRMIEGMRDVVDVQGAAIQKASEKQEEQAKKLLSEVKSTAASMPPPPPPQVIVSSPTKSSFKSVGRAASDSVSGLPFVKTQEIGNIRREIQNLKKSYSNFVDDFNASVTAIKKQAQTAHGMTSDAKIASPNVSIDGGKISDGRAYLEKGKSELGANADALVNRVDDLQDIVEDLRKDVVSRGVRPHPQQLENVSKDIARARTELKKMDVFAKKEKPIWKKVWEKELQVVVDDQQWFNMQEDLIKDLEDDLEKLAETFALVEQCTREQNGVKASPRGGFNVSDEDPLRTRDGILGEVKALKPNTENRLEAIERAEKARQKELAMNMAKFQQEVNQVNEEVEVERKRRLEDTMRLHAEARKNGPTTPSDGKEEFVDAQDALPPATPAK